MATPKPETLFERPECAHNRAKTTAERRGGCAAATNLKPGAAAGGCAFDGAKICLQPIADCAHLTHGPMGCEGNSWDSRHSLSSGPELYRTGLTTDLSELDIIHGGEAKLHRAIGAVIERFDPKAVFVYATCVSALIGDDVEAVAAQAAKAFGRPVIPVDAPGFVGSKSLGNRLGGEALFRHVIGTREPAETTDTDLVILGEYNVAGEMWQVTPLLARLGIRVAATITGDGRYDAIASCHRSRLAFVVCSQAMVTLAHALQDRYGIPYLEGSFYGIGDTSRSLRAIVDGLIARGAPVTLRGRCEALIAEEEARAWAALEPYRARLAGKRVLLYTGGVKSWSVIAALQEIGMQVVGTSVRKSTAEDKAKATALLGAEANLFGQMPAREMDALFRNGGADILVSGGRSQFTALKAKLPWLDINQERPHAYAGYTGMVGFVRQLDACLNNPIWPQVRKPAPWAAGAA